MIKILTLPFQADIGGFDDEIIHSFLANKTVQTIKSELFQQNSQTYWTVWIEYEPVLTGTEKKPIQALTETQQTLLQALQKWRREWADQQKIPVFIVATNKELEMIAINQPSTLEGLRSIQGFGRKKTEKYGQLILQLVARFKTAEEQPKIITKYDDS